MSLFVPACNKNSTNIAGTKASSDTTTENNGGSSTDRGSEDNDTPEPKPPYSSTTLVQITCDSGCKVKKDGDVTEQSVYKNYFDNSVTLNFTFSKTDVAYSYPTLLVKAIKEDSTSTVVTELTEYTYNQSTGALKFNTDFSKYNIVTIDAYAVEPAAEVKFYNTEAATQNLTFQYSGSLTALDFNGDVVNAKDIVHVDEGKVLVSYPIHFDSETHTATLKLYGNCSTILFTCQNITELCLNHVTTFDLYGYINNSLRNLKKLYIGPDVTNIANTSMFKERVLKGGVLVYLNEIEVSEENPLFDSRDNCNCLIDTSANRLILGSGEGFVPEGVTTIASGAFAANQRLSYIRLPSTVTTIEEGAFANSSLSYIEFSKNLNTVMDLAFCQCNSLIMVDFSNMSKAPNMTTNAFMACKYLEDHKDTLKFFVHHNSDVLGEIRIQLSMVDTKWGGYERNFVINRFELPSFVMVSELDPDFVPDKEGDVESTKVDFSSNDKIDLNKSLIKVFDPSEDKIDECSWSDAGSSIVTGGLYNDPVMWDGNRSSYIVASYPIDGSGNPVPFSFSFRSNDELYFRNAEDVCFIKHFGDCGFKEIPTEEGPDLVPAIDDNTFKGLTSLTDFVYSANPLVGPIGYIGAHAFEDTGIRSAEIPAINLQFIGDFAFAGCANLKTFHLDDVGRVITPKEESKPLNIGNFAFRGDISLTSFDLPSYVNSFYDSERDMYNNPFTGCSSLRTINCLGENNNFRFDTNKILIDTSYHDIAVSIFAKNLTSSIVKSCQGQFANGAFTTLSSLNPVINFKFIERRLSEYEFAYMRAKKITFVNISMTANYMFAYCKDLEVLDLSNGGLVDGDIDKTTLFKGTNPNFRVKIPSEKELSDYKDILGLDDESKFFWDTPEP